MSIKEREPPPRYTKSAPDPDMSFVHIINDGPRDVVVEVVSEHTTVEPVVVPSKGKAYKGLTPYRYVLIRYKP